MKPTWNPVGDWVQGMADDTISNLAKAIMEGMSQMVTTLSTFWVSMPAVNLTTEDGMAASPVVGVVNDELKPWTLALAVLAVIIGGIRMIWEQRGAPLKDLLRSLLTLALVSGLGLGVIAILVVATDALAAALIDRGTGGKGFASSMSLLVMTGQTGIGVFILIVLGVIGLIVSLVQIVLMIVRSGMLVILAGILPTTAAFTNTEMGRQWFQKAVGWTIAFILYKPAAAAAYSVAFLLMGNTSGRDALLGSISGFTLMIVALLALPALMRFVTPMVGAVAAAGSGAAGGAAVGALATGAVSMGRSGSGRGNAAPIPASTSNTSSTHTSDSPKGSPGSSGPRGGGGQPTPGTTGPDSAAGKAGAAASAGSAAATTGAAATGPAGMAVTTGVRVASRTSEAIKTTAQDSTGEGPSGSN